LFHAAKTYWEMSFRSEAFTVLALGNAFATSGSRITTFAPSAYRRAYLPRVAREKSYSSRIPFRIGLVDVFFINLALSPARVSCADNADIIASLSVNHNEQLAVVGAAHRNLALLR
jgi:hypothetical protein